MKNNDYFRYLNDIHDYKLCLPPYGYDYYNMTVKQARAQYEWFISVIPERVNYLKKRCAEDLKIKPDLLDYSADSLKLLWEWFIGVARVEKTPPDELEKMKEAAKVFGESFINYKQFTVVTQYIMRDIAVYIGESFVNNYPKLKWTYCNLPKNYVNSREPVISGFYIKDEFTEGEMDVNPMGIVTGAGSKFFTGKPDKNDIYNSYTDLIKRIPN